MNYLQIIPFDVFKLLDEMECNIISCVYMTNKYFYMMLFKLYITRKISQINVPLNFDEDFLKLFTPQEKMRLKTKRQTAIHCDDETNNLISVIHIAKMCILIRKNRLVKLINNGIKFCELQTVNADEYIKKYFRTCDYTENMYYLNSACKSSEEYVRCDKLIFYAEFLPHFIKPRSYTMETNEFKELAIKKFLFEKFISYRDWIIRVI